MKIKKLFSEDESRVFDAAWDEYENAIEDKDISAADKKLMCRNYADKKIKQYQKQKEEV